MHKGGFFKGKSAFHIYHKGRERSCGGRFFKGNYFKFTRFCVVQVNNVVAGVAQIHLSGVCVEKNKDYGSEFSF